MPSPCSSKCVSVQRGLLTRWTSLADAFNPPSDSSLNPKTFSWTCEPCQFEVSGPGPPSINWDSLQAATDLEILTHVCSREHFQTRGLDVAEFGYSLLVWSFQLF